MVLRYLKIKCVDELFVLFTCILSKEKTFVLSYCGMSYICFLSILIDKSLLAYFSYMPLSLHSRSAGRANVNVTFSCDFITPGSNSGSRFYSASVSLLVVADLPLALGVPITWVLPPHYTTTSLLPSSSESYGQGDGQSRKGTIVYSLSRCCGEKNEAVQKDSISIHRDRIKTTDSNNLACIQAKDRTTGRIEIASCVRVAEVWIFDHTTGRIEIASYYFYFSSLNILLMPCRVM